jgi:TatD DNase family protein
MPAEMLVDTHAHLDMAELAGDLEGVLGRARDAGVSRIVTIGTDEASSRAAVSLAAGREPVFCAVGLHPHEASRWSAGLAAELLSLAASPKVVAWGEVGLDFYRMHSPRPAQERAFREQIGLAAQRGLPLIVHVRDAHEEALAILAQEGASRGVFHCFSGNERLAERVLELGFYISLAGPLTFKNASKPVRVAERVPLGRLLVETDCPYLAPVPHRGRRNEPAYLVHTAARLAEIKGVEVAEVARATTRNAKNLFGLGSP